MRKSSGLLSWLISFYLFIISLCLLDVSLGHSKEITGIVAMERTALVNVVVYHIDTNSDGVPDLKNTYVFKNGKLMLSESVKSELKPVVRR